MSHTSGDCIGCVVAGKVVAGITAGTEGLGSAASVLGFETSGVEGGLIDVFGYKKWYTVKSAVD